MSTEGNGTGKEEPLSLTITSTPAEEGGYDTAWAVSRENWTLSEWEALVAACERYKVGLAYERLAGGGIDYPGGVGPLTLTIFVDGETKVGKAVSSFLPRDLSEHDGLLATLGLSLHELYGMMLIMTKRTGGPVPAGPRIVRPRG